MPIFWNVTPCTLVEAQQCFKRTHHLQLQGKRESQEKKTARSRQQAEQTIFRRPESDIDKNVKSGCSKNPI
jgi:hypothetical protein